MKFAPNRLYVESYAKCPNCGILLYENPANEAPDTTHANGQIYCSAWCVTWEAEREERRREVAETGTRRNPAIVVEESSGNS